jgi:hypothetical protein
MVGQNVHYVPRLKSSETPHLAAVIVRVSERPGEVNLSVPNDGYYLSRSFTLQAVPRDDGNNGVYAPNSWHFCEV